MIDPGSNLVDKNITFIHSPDKLSDHDIVSGTLKIAMDPPYKETRRKGIVIRKVIMNL